MTELKDDAERGDWLEALDLLEAFEGLERVDEVLEAVVTSARRKGAKLPFAANTAYVNTIPPEQQPQHPGDRKLEMKTVRYVRWNAAAIVLARQQSQLGAGRTPRELPVGGHAVRYRLHAFLACGRASAHGGDLVYIQGHSSPGIYARAFLEGRLSEDQW